MKDIWAAVGAAAWGCCALADLPMDRGARRRAEALCPGGAGVLAAAFPYYAGERPGNLSRYARGMDYHAALGRRLERAARLLAERYPGRRLVPGVDDSPLPEREAARLAGIGILGDHGLIILPPYGSWIFLGTLLTDLPLPSAAEPSPGCHHCGACRRACPGRSLGADGRVDQSRCLSALTQRNGPLEPEQARLVEAHELIWGCDRCQTVCPYNRQAAETSLPEFREGLICSLEAGDVAGLTRRQLVEKYPLRAFTWRGPGPLRRNLEGRRG